MNNPWTGLGISGDLPKLREVRSDVLKEYDDEMLLDIREYKGFMKNKKCLILGNGPHARQAPIEYMRSKYKNNMHTFCCNYYNLFYKFKPDFWVNIDVGAYIGMKDILPKDIPLFMNVPTIHMPINQSHIWIHEVQEEIRCALKIPELDLERPCTVAIPMLAFAMYLGYEEIMIAGVELSRKSTTDNYAYSLKVDTPTNLKFVPFIHNYEYIIEQFKLLKDAADELGIKVNVLKLLPDNFKVFPLREDNNGNRLSER